MTGSETDHEQLVGMIEHVAENTGQVAAETLADAGYWGGAQLSEAEKRRLPVLVNEQASSDEGEFSKARFQYHAERNGYVCPLGEFLP